MNENSTSERSEELLQTTARNVGNLANQIEDTVNRGKQKLSEMQEALMEKTKAAAETTDQYVHENPWKAIGVAASLGLIVGLLLRRR